MFMIFLLNKVDKIKLVKYWLFLLFALVFLYGTGNTVLQEDTIF